jgi:hypothetical protein
MLLRSDCFFCSFSLAVAGQGEVEVSLKIGWKAGGNTLLRIS